MYDLTAEKAMAESLIIPWNDGYQDYLSDESRRAGEAESISFPTSEAEVIEVLREMRARGVTVTVQGNRTGIVAGAVPQGGHVMNLSRMNRIGEVSGELRLTVQPGALLDDIRASTHDSGLMFPPDPTETTASIGGMVASNASGAMSFHYGPTRDWVAALRVALADGSVLSLRRGERFADGRSFSLTTEDGRAISGDVPSYTMPDVKSAAGYFVRDGVDLIDLFIGMEGTLGVITEIELRLTPRPAAITGLTMFPESEEAALKLVRVLRQETVEGFEPPPVRPVAIEFFNSDALELLRRMRGESAAFARIPTVHPHFHTAIYAEFHGDDEESLEEAALHIMEQAAELGVSDADTWYATTEREMEPLKAFRHAVPEAVNLLIGERKRSCPGLTKLGTDMSVPDECLESAMAMYNAGLAEAGLESVVFGHIGNNHVHVNILPHDLQEYDTGKSLYLSWARCVTDMRGSVSAEHGIGKIKAPFLAMMYDEDAIQEMRSLRRLFDPDATLNPCNLFC